VINYANRGMGLETLIEYANEQYSAKGIATIQKVSTPWKVIRNGKQIVSAYPEKKSTVDFIGVKDGISIAFDAKETENKTRFPYANIEKHQLDFLHSWQLNGGIAFLLINFKMFDETYLVPYSSFVLYKNIHERESMSYAHIKSAFKRVTQGNGIVLDYLDHIEITEVAG
jgi:recombination protein U